MEPRLIALLILLPFVAAFVYAAVHEYRRFNSQGSATYGLVYDEDTGTTHVTEIPDHEESFDLEAFDPNDWNGFGGQIQTDNENVPDTEDTGDMAEDRSDTERSPGEEQALAEQPAATEKKSEKS